MPSDDLHIDLAEVQQKLKRLLDKHSALQKENSLLQVNYNNSLDELKTKDEQIKHLTHQIVLLKSGIQQWHPEQKKLFVKRIDIYLREIEKCLALINE